MVELDKARYHYRVVVQRQKDTRWSWEILRTPELGVHLYDDNFPSEQAAKLAGEKALHDLLVGIANDEKGA